MRIHWPLVGIITLFIIPIVAAGCLLYLNKNPNFSSTAHGAIIEKPQKLTLKDIEYLDGQDFTKKWSLVYVQPEECGSACELQKEVLHNLYTSLGPDRDRVVIITTTPNNIDAEVETNDLLILNPHGLHIMQYNDLVNHTGLLKDLRKLLKYSHA